MPSLFFKDNELCVKCSLCDQQMGHGTSPASVLAECDCAAARGEVRPAEVCGNNE